MGKKITIIGAGIVGYALGQTLRRADFKTMFVDTNALRVAKLKESGFEATTNIKEAINDMYFVCVPTPSKAKDGSFEGKSVLSVVSGIFKIIEENVSLFPVIVVKSTVLPNFHKIILKQTPLKLGKDFGLVINPEFLRSETAEEDMLYETVILGAEDKKSFEKVRGVYQVVERKLGIKFRFICTDFITASLMKYKHNLWLTTSMGFLMEFAKLCRAFGVNPYEVIRSAPNPDPVSWVRHDFIAEGFLDECLPKDCAALSAEAAELGVRLQTVESALLINREIIAQNGHLPYDPRRLKLIEKVISRENIKAIP